MIEEYIERHERTENTESIGYVQQLVRCKNCKHRYDNDQKCPFCNECGGRDYPGDNWFCADGEQNDDFNEVSKWD